MPEYLTFTLAAPIAAMGGIAVGERRGTWDRPGRSAVLGLVAACLGLDRADEDAHGLLEASYALALRVEWVGPLLADYHTAQVPPARRGRRFATRAQELDRPSWELNTILSRRDYRCDVLAFVALWLRIEAPRWPLAALADALRAPEFTPYFGRKSCPLMLPFGPRVAEAEDAVAALAAHAETLPLAGALVAPWGRAAAPVVALDRDAAGGHEIARVERRRDAIASRRRWQFALRDEAVLKAAGP